MFGVKVFIYVIIEQYLGRGANSFPSAPTTSGATSAASHSEE